MNTTWGRRALAAALAAALLVGPASAGSSAAPAAPTPRGEDLEKVTFVTSDPENDPLGAYRAYLELMAIPSVNTGYVPESAAPGTDGRRACPKRRCRDYRVPVPDGVTIDDNRVRVLFPAGYRKHKSRRYPVVFAYNGARSRYDQWTISTEITRMTRRLPAIVVFPSGGRNEEAGMNSDWHDGSFQWETFHTEVLVDWVDRRFRTLPGARGAMGASMGGLGALIYAARNPGVFRSVLSISGITETDNLLLNGLQLPAPVSSALELSPPDLSRVWGNPLLQRANWEAHNPRALAADLRGVDLFLASGTGASSSESESGDAIHSARTEQTLWTGHRSFLLALTRARVPYEARVRQGGNHTWSYFDTHLEWGLPKLVAALREPAHAP